MGYINDQGEYVNESRGSKDSSGGNIFVRITKFVVTKNDKEIKRDNTPKLSLISIFLPFATIIIPIYLYFTGSSAVESFIIFCMLGISIYVNDLLANKTGMALALFIFIGIFLGINNGGGSIIGGILIGAFIGIMVEILNKFKF